MFTASSPSPHAYPSMFPLPSITGVDALHNIDTEILRLKEQIRALRQLRNTVIPIGRLPVEILSQVFLHCHLLDKRAYTSRLTVSWVSRHWRDVALDDPALWSQVLLFHPKEPNLPSSIEHLQQCFVRSKSLPLTIAYYGPQLELFALCASQLQRTRKLCINHCNTEDTEKPLPNEWHHPAPSLLELELTEISLEEDFFRGVDPPLQSLAVELCVSVWDSPLSSLSTLTNLEIYRPSDFVTARELVDRLQYLPALKSCSFYGCFYAEPAATISEPHAYLPNLEYLSIGSINYGPLAEVLRCIDIPNASVEVIHSIDEPTEAGFVESFQWFKEYQDRHWKDIHNISLTRRPDCGGLDSESIAYSVTVNQTPNRQFTFSFDPGIEQGYFKFDPTLHSSPYLPLRNARTLSLNRASVKGLSSFKRLPRLEVLSIEEVGTDVVQWFKTSSSSAFPALKTLKVGNVTYPSVNSFVREQERSRYLVGTERRSWIRIRRMNALWRDEGLDGAH